jgi:hypothetical protein
VSVGAEKVCEGMMMMMMMMVVAAEQFTKYLQETERESDR